MNFYNRERSIDYVDDDDPTFIMDSNLSIRNICELRFHPLRKGLREINQLDQP